MNLNYSIFFIIIEEKNKCSMQNLINWGEKYSLGIITIDNQHKTWIDLINRLYQAFKRVEARIIIDELLTDTINFTQKHFSTEENYFTKFNYSEKESHIGMHHYFSQCLENMKSRLDEKDISVTFDFMNLLRNWLINHILFEDRKYVDLFVRNGVI
jgi:hemerythrin-like metal-binding protein